jgi:hypothetical protein
MSEMLFDGNGHYWRDSAGVWRYTVNGQPVPGARNRSGFDVEHPYPRVQVDGLPYVAVPAHRLDTHPELVPLAASPGALVEYSGGTPSTFLVPLAAWPAERGGGSRIWAPELEPDQLLTMRQLAELVGCGAAARQLLREGHLPAPVVILNVIARAVPRYFWTRPVLAHWLEAKGAYLAQMRAENREKLARWSKARAAAWAAGELADWPRQGGRKRKHTCARPPGKRGRPRKVA